MATENFTGDGEQKTLAQILCTASTADEIQGQLTFVTVLNIFLFIIDLPTTFRKSISITAFLVNALILAALNKKSSLFPPSKLFLRSLATTDLCVGFISEPLVLPFGCR